MLSSSTQDLLLATVGLSVICNTLVVQLVGPWLLQLFFRERFSRLSLSKQQWLRKLTMSIMSSAIVGSTAVLTHLSEQLDPRHLRHDVPAVSFNCAFMLGHTLTDTLAHTFIRTPTMTNYLQLIVHHIITLGASFAGTFSSSLPYYVNIGLMMEVSTVFYCSGIMMKELSYPRLYLLVIFAFLMTFFCTRIIFGFCIFWYHLMPLLLTTQFYQLGVPVLLACLGCFPVLQLLNLVWFPLACRRLIREWRVINMPESSLVENNVKHSKNA
ncbi:PREDICTED: transmembrane protein 56-B-like isoform X2 [Branchiostoma belcheri]|uniref:Transmembrane protein 56-B-like isoform X2 n=1 Tax=Branchiostoma belcheri TaxID=7741 RepID=A0A6P4Y488_BRABE|nr:PREDICTED: transmembrane protein 56-B-like isoform X2 [Branchiostoma belcheri]